MLPFKAHYGGTFLWGQRSRFLTCHTEGGGVSRLAAGAARGGKGGEGAAEREGNGMHARGGCASQALTCSGGGAEQPHLPPAQATRFLGEAAPTVTQARRQPDAFSGAAATATATPAPPPPHPCFASSGRATAPAAAAAATATGRRGRARPQGPRREGGRGGVEKRCEGESEERHRQ